MTVHDAISRVSALRQGNRYTPDELTAWLGELDAQVWQDIVLTHERHPEDGLPEEQPHYSPETDGDAVLLAPFPHDRMYVTFLEARIDYANAEYGRYNNSLSTFNAEYSAYRNWYNSTHMPLKGRLRLL